MPESSATQIDHVRPRSAGLPLAPPDQPLLLFLPEGDENSFVADPMQGMIAKTLSLETEIFHGMDILGALQSRHSILIGHLGNNPAVRTLYHCGWTYADASFPARDSVLLQSLHNTWGTGTHAFLVASSSSGSIRGLAMAVKTLCNRILALKSPEIPFIYEICKSGRKDGLHQETPIEDASEGWVQTDASGSGWRRAAWALETFRLSGQVRFLDAFREAIGAASPKGETEGGFLGALGDAVRGWNILEEHPFFAEEDRQSITQRLLAGSHEVFQAYGKQLRAAPDSCEKSNYEAAFALYLAAEYFLKYYNLAEARDWLEAARYFLQHQGRTALGFVESDSLLEWIASAVMFPYALRSGDTAYLESGGGWRTAQRLLAATDNLGFNAGYGVGSQPCHHSPTRARVLRMARTWYREPVFEWAIWHFYENCPPAAGDFEIRGVNQRLPHEWLGLKILASHPISSDPGPSLQSAAGDALAGNLPGDAADTEMGEKKEFDKACFRRGFLAVDEYLLLSGRGSGAQSHFHTAAILRLTAQDRLWLVDAAALRRDENLESMRNERAHNRVLVTRDGQTARVPPNGRLEAAQDLPNTGFLKILIPDYGGVDWVRTVVWWKGEFFLIADEVSARVGGSFLLECLFHVLGRGEQKGKALRLEQFGPTFTLEEAGESELEVLEQEIPHPERFKDSLSGAEAFYQVSARQKANLAEGQKRRFVHLLGFSRGSYHELEILGPDLFRIVRGPRSFLVGLGPADGTEGITTDAALFVSTQGFVAVLGAEHFSNEDFRFRSESGPMSRELMAPAVRGYRAANVSARR